MSESVFFLQNMYDYMSSFTEKLNPLRERTTKNLPLLSVQP